MKLVDDASRLLAASWEVVTFVDSDGVITYQSDAAETVLGTDADRFVGESFYELVHPGDREAVSACVETVLANRDATPSTELRYEHPDGSTRVLESRFVNLDDGVVVYTRDITHRALDETRLELLLSVSRDLMATASRVEIASNAVDAANDLLDLPYTGVHLYDPDSGSLPPVETTDAVEMLFDGDPPTYTERNDTVWSVFGTENASVVNDTTELPGKRARQTPSKSVMIIGLGDHGVFITSSAETHAFDETDVYFAKLLAQNVRSALDATDRERSLRRREEALVEQNARLDAFAQVLSHDLRNPLSVATGYLEWYRESGDEAHYGRVETALDRIDAIIEDVLSLASDPDEESRDEVCEIETIAEAAWKSIARNDTAFVVTAKTVIEGDPSRLQRLFENVFRNAIEHGRNDGTLTITVGDVDETGFFVADDGVGIAEADIDRVFEDGYTTTNHGTGLGLSIVKQIAADYDLETTVTVDNGTRFEFTPAD